MLKIQNFRVPLEEERSLEALVAKHYHLPLPVVRRVRIVRQAVDARRRPRISFVYTLGVELADEQKYFDRLAASGDVSRLEETALKNPQPGTVPLTHPPVVVGMGPAGLLAALTLAHDLLESQSGKAPMATVDSTDAARKVADMVQRAEAAIETHQTALF